MPDLQQIEPDQIPCFRMPDNSGTVTAGLQPILHPLELNLRTAAPALDFFARRCFKLLLPMHAQFRIVSADVENSLLHELPPDLRVYLPKHLPQVTNRGLPSLDSLNMRVEHDLPGPQKSVEAILVVPFQLKFRPVSCTGAHAIVIYLAARINVFFVSEWSFSDNPGKATEIFRRGHVEATKEQSPIRQRQTLNQFTVCLRPFQEIDSRHCRLEDERKTFIFAQECLFNQAIL